VELLTITVLTFFHDKVDIPWYISGRRDRDLIAAGFTTTYAIGAYHH
jgi:hypothetical protein